MSPDDLKYLAIYAPHTTNIPQPITIRQPCASIKLVKDRGHSTVTPFSAVHESPRSSHRSPSNDPLRNKTNLLSTAEYTLTALMKKSQDKKELKKHIYCRI